MNNLHLQPASLKRWLGVAAGVLICCAKNIPLTEVQATTDAAIVARGEYLVEHVGVCTTCHTPRDFRIFSGPPLVEQRGAGADIGMVFGYQPPQMRIWAPNITPAALEQWTDAELQRAFVSGLHRDGHSLILAMPYNQFNALSVEDARAIVSYLRSLPSITSAIPARVLPFPVDPFVNLMPMAPHLVEKTPTPANGLAYGKYLTTVAGCLWCHSPVNSLEEVVSGKEWSGGHAFPLPTPGPELGTVVAGSGLIRTPNISRDAQTGIGTWSRALFVQRFRSATAEALGQVRPGRLEMNSIMPWVGYSGMTEEDLGAIYDFLMSYPAQFNLVNRFDPGPLEK